MIVHDKERVFLGMQTPKARYRNNGFVVAFEPQKGVRLDYVPRTRSELFAVCYCNDDWQVRMARGGIRSIDEALAVAEKEFGVSLETWTIMSDEMQPWTNPSAAVFEKKRLALLTELRRRQQVNSD
ncbi:MAG: hypothetical protein AAGH88_00115 [Planctomycetota bacterium]